MHQGLVNQVARMDIGEQQEIGIPYDLSAGRALVGRRSRITGRQR